MRFGFFTDVLTFVDIREIVEIGRKVIEIYEGVLYRENFKVSLLKKVIDKLIDLRQNFKDEKNDVKQLLVKMIMNSLYCEQIRKDIEESYDCKLEDWMRTEYDKRVSDYQKNFYGKYLVKLKDDAELQG